MIDRLRSVGLIKLPRSLKTVLTRNSGEERLVDDRSDEAWAENPMMTPEDRILALLAGNEGRMWQQSIVAETRYSEATVSRLLCELEADDLVDRHWRGGEKVVVLDQESAEAVRAEHDLPGAGQR